VRSLEGKVAIITGGASGIGKAIAKSFAQLGAKLTVFCPFPDELEQARSELNTEGATMLALLADVSRLADVQQVVTSTVEEWGRIDILVNNAGILPPVGPLAEMSVEDWNKVIAVNLTGMFYTCREVWPHLLAAGGGAIVNIASVGGVKGIAEMAAYCATKGGVLALSGALAKEGAPFGIRVNSVAPGFIDTPLNDHLLMELEDPEQWLADTLTNIPLGRAGRPKEIARAVVFLASDDASYITGQTIVVDGGAIG